MTQFAAQVRLPMMTVVRDFSEETAREMGLVPSGEDDDVWYACDENGQPDRSRECYGALMIGEHAIPVLEYIDWYSDGGQSAEEYLAELFYKALREVADA